MNRQLYALNRIKNFYGFSVLQMELPRNMFKGREEETSLTDFIQMSKGPYLRRAPWENEDKLNTLNMIEKKEETFDWSGTAASKAKILAIPLLIKYATSDAEAMMSHEESGDFLYGNKADAYLGILLKTFSIDPQDVADEDKASFKELLSDIYVRRDIAFLTT